MQSFCSQCNETVEVRIREVTKREKLRGRDIEYKGKEAVCIRCGELVAQPNLSEENELLAKEAFREKEKLILIKEIEEILDKYKIGKRPLSLLLGWGEGTLTRYIAGDLPTRQYSATLKRILDDPAYYEEVLEENRKAITYQAYNRSKKALELLGYVTRQMTVESLCSDSLAVAAGRFLGFEADMPLEKLQIMLYYLQGFHMAFWRREIFPEDCVGDGIMPEYKAITALYPTGKLKQGGLDAGCLLSEPETILIDTLMRWLGCFGVAALKRIMVAESPHFVCQKGEANEEIVVFSKDNLASHFSRIMDKYHMTSIMDIADYSHDIVHKI
jgi:hypothetical protein